MLVRKAGDLMKTFLYPLRLILVGMSVMAAMGVANADLIATATVQSEWYAPCQQTTATSATCGGEWSAGYAPGYFQQFAGNAYAAAGYGVLRASSSASASCTFGAGDNCYTYAGYAEGFATFNDLLTITGAPAAGFLDFSLVADGTGNVTCGVTLPCSGSTLLGVDNTGSSAPIINGVGGDAISLSPGTTDITVLLPYAFVAGEDQIGVGMSFESMVTCYEADEDSCSAYADFSDTAIITGLSVLDASGNAVSGAVVAAASGTDYNDVRPLPAVVPEPSSVLLLAVPLLAVALRRTFWRQPAKI
jgi:hypothetical protein